VRAGAWLFEGFKSFNHTMSILISSPKVQAYYHADVPGQTLWQVRETKRVYVYPNTPPFLPQAALAKLVLGEAHEISLKLRALVWCARRRHRPRT
jgi:hypothetical protein